MIIKCPECGKEVSNSAPNCIHCGYPFDCEKDTYIVESNNESTTAEHGNNWWINWGSLVIVTTAIFLLLISVILLVMGIYLICDSNEINHKADIGIPLSIIGGICFILCVISFVVSRNCERKYGLKKTKPNTTSNATTIKANKKEKTLKLDARGIIIAVMILMIIVIVIGVILGDDGSGNDRGTATCPGCKKTYYAGDSGGNYKSIAYSGYCKSCKEAIKWGQDVKDYYELNP